MKFLKKLVPFILQGALTLSNVKINAEPLSINFFPEMPVHRSTLTNSDILKTEINLPLGLEKGVLDRPISELLPYTSLSGELSLLSLEIESNGIPKIVPQERIFDANLRSLHEKNPISDKIFSASLIASGRLKFFNNKNPEYKARAELFLGSPIIDDYLSDGNKLFLTAGVNFDGSLNLEGRIDKPISSFYEIFNRCLLLLALIDTDLERVLK